MHSRLAASPRISIDAARVVAVGIMIASVVGAIAIGAAPARAQQSAARTSEGQVAQSLTCQCGCGLTVANCNMPTCGFSVPLRTQIEGMIGRGMSRAQIVAFFRKEYGEKILSAPTTEGFNLLAWTMPFIALVLGGGLIAIAAKRWHHAPLVEAGGDSREPPRDPVFDPELRRKLEAELKES